jgi:hypothetical protein
MRIQEAQNIRILRTWILIRIRYTAKKSLQSNFTYLTGVQDGRAHVQLPGLRAGPHLCPLCRLLQGPEVCTLYRYVYIRF